MNVIIFRDYKEENWHSMEVYADNLVKYLKLNFHDEINIREHVTAPWLSSYFPANRKHIRHIFRYIINPLRSAFLDADVFHITDQANAHLLLALDPKKTIVTVHDLTAPYWLMKNIHPTLKKRLKFKVERWRIEFLKKARHIIAVSEATKQEIIETLNIKESNISVVHEGAEDFFQPASKEHKACVKDRYKLPKTFILHVGTTYENKNMEGLLDLFFQIASSNKNIHLVKVGEDWTDKQLNKISNSAFRTRINHIGFVPTKDLSAIYSSATILVQPSFAEGFGFTVLEAMICGCPVIVSDIPALREIVGNAGVYISPYSYNNNSKIVEKILTNTKQRKILRTRGITKSKKYTWNHCAIETFKLYKEVVSKIYL